MNSVQDSHRSPNGCFYISVIMAESTSRILERELAAGGRLGSEEEPRAAPFDWANWYDNFRIHSTLGYMSPVEFREAGLILS